MDPECGQVPGTFWWGRNLDLPDHYQSLTMQLGHQFLKVFRRRRRVRRQQSEHAAQIVTDEHDALIEGMPKIQALQPFSRYS